MFRKHEGEPNRDDNTEETNKESLKQRHAFAPRFDSKTIKTIIQESPEFKIYLDALPDMLKRGVQLFEISDGQIVGEAFGPKETRSDEIARSIILRHGYDYWRKQSRAVSWIGPPDSLDLIRFYYYYHPDEDPEQ